MKIKDKEGFTPLLHACAGGHEEVVSFFLKKGADIKVVDSAKRSCLHLAAMAGSSSLLKLLSEKGLSTAAKDRYGRTISDFAASSGNLAFYKLHEEKSPQKTA